MVSVGPTPGKQHKSGQAAQKRTRSKRERRLLPRKVTVRTIGAPRLSLMALIPSQAVPIVMGALRTTDVAERFAAGLAAEDVPLARMEALSNDQRAR